MRWNTEYTEIVPHLATSFEVDDNGRQFTFHLRKGVRWSDGEPFTVEDVAFNVENLLLDEDFAPVPTSYMTGGVPVVYETVDEDTVRFTFEEPNGDFLALLGGPLGQHPVLYPKHYCSQFHPDFNPEIDQLIEENQASDWQNLFLQKCGATELPARWGNPDKPTLDPWVITEPYDGGATRVVLERNPYFWQVDTEGNQLPYLDKLSASVSQDVESLILAIIGGDIDFGLRHIDSPADRPVLAANREKGDYRMFAAVVSGFNIMMIDLNLTHKDPELREIFNQKDFRVALSLGMDRQEIIDTVLLGVGEPWQQGPFEEDNPYYHEQFSTQYIEYDPERANELLDGMGLDKRGPDGMRLMPNGEPLSFQIDAIPTFRPEWVDTLEMVRMQWAEIGVDMSVNAVERTFFYERTSNSNEHDAAVWVGGAPWIPGSDPHQMIPINHDARWGIAWRDWYESDGEEGMEPPESIKERFRLYDEVRSTTDPEERLALVRQAIQIAADEFEVFGVSKAMPTYGIVKNDLKNVPESMLNWWDLATPAHTHPQTWYWADE
ncbi:ABC transporter substrate-binding protein [Psychromarinibacter sp. C21-152]|uniref:ABC transporter substrate-binding protein n=1 Tax=Psychromarinibacter sediminicola TaxID=3033385 RepID=A0AAE3TAB9_9RHOB|nr:ABC transporter substrate-binding protein [Psychromarinibacter sediminicola]MDF0603530.1 ABC transporter substrate-binding protein [Psychromarinibacter sediminicola]